MSNDTNPQPAADKPGKPDTPVNCMGEEENQEKFMHALSRGINATDITDALKSADLLPDGAEFDTVDYGNNGMTLVIEGQVHPTSDDPDADFTMAEPIVIVLNVAVVALPNDGHVFKDHAKPEEFLP